ncbi:unnamed protein product, partial [Ixodes pacificus]
PVIQPLVLPTDATTGVSVKLFCSVQKGSRPLTFSWMKDGRVIRNGVTSLEDYSTLTMDPVTAQSAGNYTCVVSNSAGTDRYTSALEVKQPPQWVEEPRDISTVEDVEVRIPCSAAGRPKPTVTWTQ